MKYNYLNTTFKKVNNMTQSEILALKGLPIMAVAERLGIQRIDHGKRLALCPFHDDHHPSLRFNLKHNTCRCFACQDKSMDTIDLVMRALGKGFPDACRWLADGQGVILREWKPVEVKPREPRPFDAAKYERIFAHPRLGDKARHFLYDERMINEGVVHRCQLNEWTDRSGTTWLNIPYFDTDGHLVGIENRNLDPEARPRFRCPQENQNHLYNLPVVNQLKQGEPLYIAEGPSDCWALLSLGLKAVAFPSATVRPHGATDFLRTLQEQKGTSFLIYPDRDEAGEDFFHYLQSELPGIERCILPDGCKDFGEAYAKHRKEAAHEH